MFAWHVQLFAKRRCRLVVPSLPCRQVLHRRHGDACRLPSWNIPQYDGSHCIVCRSEWLHCVPYRRVLSLSRPHAAVMPCRNPSHHNRRCTTRQLRQLRCRKVLCGRHCDTDGLRGGKLLGNSIGKIASCLPAVPSRHSLPRCRNDRAHKLRNGHVSQQCGRHSLELHRMSSRLVLSFSVGHGHQVPSWKIQRRRS